MAATCTNTVSLSGCDHRTVTIVFDGVTHVLSLHESDVVDPLTVEEARLFLRLALRRVRQSGVTLAQLLNRVCVGDEATNVKVYDIIPPGSVITKTNIGAAYADVLPGSNGQRVVIDFTGCTQYRLVLSANHVTASSGQLGVRLLRDSDNAVLHENANVRSTSGEFEADTGWTALPAQAADQILVRLQAKSTVAADDPVFRRCQVLVR